MCKYLTPTGHRRNETLTTWVVVSVLSIKIEKSKFNEHEVIQNEGIQFKDN